ncbi:alanine--tRNA ligase [Mycoplasma marinum]|uniref:Alanine--tRNA ligase n=1 Tax=Mycoplasma marinum TaxID=1937190 RepID=A0A4R0XXG2_9MOLU|nr:alanine--tRNA ligase [Mycoplasma marinum]TCG11714.1 alanine--tRNA ligase [Mycoplasma marinum]
MKKLTSMELREEWLKFFESKGHLRVESKSLIPVNDPSLLWINSGVATLKDFFSGKKQPPRKRLTNSQKSIRTNDIENVGVTSRHHTLFEMLGNFSIGDYFKEEAIEFGWEFLTKVLQIEKNKLYITYYEEDKKTYDTWVSMGVDPSHLVSGNREMNFWDMGMGPCGPDTEIFFDRGDVYDKRGIELIEQDLDNDRYIEIWNIVFSEFNNDGEGNYNELAQKNIDTGAGLERIASILQGGHTNFDTDLFIPIIRQVEQLTGKKYDGEAYFTQEQKQLKVNKSFKIIADHMRAVVNAIQDGAKPSNVSRGYIIRRLIRRSYRSGLQLGIEEKTFLYKLVNIVRDSLPFEIDVKNVSSIIKKEEISFAKTIEKGEELLEKSIIPGEEFDFAIAFKLFETYGFPIELTQEILEEKGIKLDISKFEEYKDRHAEASRGKVTHAMSKQIESLTKVKGKISEFIGYGNEEMGSQNIEKGISEVALLLDENKIVESTNGIGYAIFAETPFYATSGGQRHDKGFIIQGNNKIKVLDVFKDKFGNHVHKIEGNLKMGSVKLEVDHEVRNGLMRNHSGTHLVFRALREVFGADVIEQLGSDNNEERLRFDFPCEKKPTEEEITRVENLVNEYVSRKVDRNYVITDLKGAEKLGAIMTIDEDSYSEKVRVVKFDGITTDLCGGTHVPNTSYLEKFKIKTVENKGSGVYRLEAITSKVTVDKFVEKELDKLYGEIEKLFNKNKILDPNYGIKISALNINKAKKLIENLRADNKKLSKKSQKIEVPDVVLTNGFYIDLNIKNPGQIKSLAIALRDKYPNGTFIIGSKKEKMLIAISSNQKDSNMILQNIFKETNGRGGGMKKFAQGACDNSSKLKEVIEKVING